MPVSYKEVGLPMLFSNSVILRYENPSKRLCASFGLYRAGNLLFITSSKSTTSGSSFMQFYGLIVLNHEDNFFFDFC